MKKVVLSLVHVFLILFISSCNKDGINVEKSLNGIDLSLGKKHNDMAIDIIRNSNISGNKSHAENLEIIDEYISKKYGRSIKQIMLNYYNLNEGNYRKSSSHYDFNPFDYFKNNVDKKFSSYYIEVV